MPSESQNSLEENVGDGWTTVQKPTRRLSSNTKRRRNRQESSQKFSGGAVATGSRIAQTRDASKFFEHAKAAQLRATVDFGDSTTPEQIETVLETCLRELQESNYWETVRQVLKSHEEAHGLPYRSIVCYGIGNFGTKRPTAPLWQLALAVLIRDYISTRTLFFAGDNDDVSQTAVRQCESGSTKTVSRQRSVTMHYFEPLMTVEESKVLEKLNVQIIEENERGKRLLNNDGDGDKHCMTLFYMPHCPMSLYTNVMHTNWDLLQRIAIFGNLLNNYINGGNANIVSNPQKQQTLEILEVLQPFWELNRLQISKKDVSNMPGFFEMAFNDSGFTSFATKKRITTTGADGWPKRPNLDSQTMYDGEGEVL